MSTRAVVGWSSLLVCLAGAAGCATEDNPGAVDLMCDPMTEICTRTPGTPRVLEIVSPVRQSFTRETVTIKVKVTTGVGTAETVELLANRLPLLVNGLPLKVRPPFEHAWDTTAAPEGTYEIVARATILGRRFESLPVTIVVDRTSPRVYGLTPPDGTTYASPTQAIDILFSEPIAKETVTGTAVTVAIGGVVLPTSAMVTGTEGKTVHVTIADASALKRAGSLTGTVSTMVTDLAGNPLATPFTWGWARPTEMK